MINGLLQGALRGCFALTFLLALSQASAQSLSVGSESAGVQQAWMVRNTDIEIPGTGRTISDLTAEGYFKKEIRMLLDEEIVPGTGVTLADAMDRGWSDRDIEEFIDSQTPPTTTQAEPVEPEYPELLEGTMSVRGDVQDDEAPRTITFRRSTSLDRWFAWKRRVQENHGFTFGGSWGVLWQNYTNARNGEPNAVGSKLTINLAYDILHRRKPNALSFDMAVEDRRPLGTNNPPLFGGLFAGSLVPTAATWGEFDHIGISQAYIRQNLLSNRLQYTIGKIFAPNYLDAYPFFDDNRQFLSQQFSTSPTIPSPLRGFGWVAAAFPTRSLYLKTGMFTTHSDNVGSTISDFFSKSDHFFMFEAGSSGLARTGIPIHARGPMDNNNIHLTWWYRNKLSDGSPRSYGLAFNANRMIGSQIMWFVRSGWSTGFAANWALSGGAGWRPARTTSDLLGAGWGWTRPVGSVLHSQYTGEVFYRFHVTPNFALTPDFELVLHPSLNPNVDTIWVTSLRARLSF